MGVITAHCMHQLRYTAKEYLRSLELTLRTEISSGTDEFVWFKFRPHLLGADKYQSRLVLAQHVHRKEKGEREAEATVMNANWTNRYRATR